MIWYDMIWYDMISGPSVRTVRKGGCYGWRPSSSSNCSILVVRAHPLIELRQIIPCRAIRGNRISVNSTLPPPLDSRTCINQGWRNHGAPGNPGFGNKRRDTPDGSITTAERPGYPIIKRLLTRLIVCWGGKIMVFYFCPSTNAFTNSECRRRWILLDPDKSGRGLERAWVRGTGSGFLPTREQTEETGFPHKYTGALLCFSRRGRVIWELCTPVPRVPLFAVVGDAQGEPIV